MKKVQLTGIPTLKPEDNISILEWNYGWQQDVASGAISVSIDPVLKKRRMDVDSKKMVMNYLIFGIYEGTAIGISAPANEEDGLSENEITIRRRAVRNMSPELAMYLIKEIKKANKITDSEKEEEEIETEKKE